MSESRLLPPPPPSPLYTHTHTNKPFPKASLEHQVVVNKRGKMLFFAFHTLRMMLEMWIYQCIVLEGVLICLGACFSSVLLYFEYNSP